MTINLKQHFFFWQVDLDELHLIGSQDLHLICRLEDKYLPSVPLLHIVVPRDYPRTAPFCDSQQPDYGITKKEFVIVVAFALIFLSLSLLFMCRRQWLHPLRPARFERSIA